MRPSIVRLVAVSTFLVVLSILAFFSVTARSQEPPGDPVKGAQVYASNCAPCHGKQGEGNVGIPALAGGAGHIQQLGIPPEAAGPGFIKLLRDGIPGNMPFFPSNILSDGDIGNLLAFLVTLRPTTGDNLYRAYCALCHGTKGEGLIGPPLAGVAEKLPQFGLTKEQLAAGFPSLVRGGIPGKMPVNPQLTDGEISSLFDHLFGLPGVDPWAVQFEAEHGRPPTAQDRAARDWSLQFLRTTGRAPTQADWEGYWRSTR